MKKLFLLPLLALTLGLVLFAGSAAAPKHASAQCTPGPTAPSCGGAACAFDIYVPAGQAVYVCTPGLNLNWIQYSRNQTNANTAVCFASGFTGATYNCDYRLNSVQSITFYSNHPNTYQKVNLVNSSGVTIHFVGSAG